MSDIPVRRSTRNAKLAKIPLGIAGRAAVGFGKRLAGGDREQIDAQLTRKAAEQLFSILGELKGGAMKVGQGLSVMEAAIPEQYAEPFREALTKLQSEAPPMSAPTVHKVLDQQLGTKWRERFTSFEDTPAASASIGQVHRAVWSDGRDVAVKVQYPGADMALRADLKTLARFAGMFASALPGVDVKPVIAEITERLEEELDYRIEAANQRRFAEVFAGDPEIVVPKVVASSPKVVVTEWITAVPLSRIIKDGTREQRNSIGSMMARFHFSSPALVGLLHGDPHPGNFMLLDDGRLAVIDYGACAPLPDGLSPVLGRIIRLTADGDFEQLTQLLHEQNFVLPGRTLTKEEVDAYLKPVTDPLKTETFHFTRKWLQRAAWSNVWSEQGMEWNSQEMKTARALNLPAEYLMIFRVLIGSIGILAQLDAEAPFMRMVAEWMPGYAD